ncbi:MAG: hypothetical protein L0Z70_03255 [Chloroflexi bacterium]|nr:hypothetical protein [Chloroflexota bacterium]
MKESASSRTVLLVFVLLASALLAFAWPAGLPALGSAPEAEALAPSGTAFSYQGRLLDNDVPAEGNYDIQFLLFDAATDGTQIGATEALGDVLVRQGYFVVKLDFGAAAFGGGARWLQINVRPGASTGNYTALSPRQKLTPAPSALSLPNVYVDEATNFVGVGRNFRISGNEVFGVRYTGSANQYGGMYVETSNAGGWPFYGYATNGSFRAWTYYNGTTGDWSLYSAGVRLKVPSTGGLRIGPSLNYSLVISNTTGSDGVRILDTGDDAIQIGSNPDIPNYGVYIPSPGVSTYGLWSNTSNALGEWALYSVDNVQAGNVVANAYSLVVQVSGEAALSPGDLAAVSGVTAPMPGGATPTPLVTLADAANSGVIGVVASRMVWEVAPGKEAEGEMSLHSVEGAAQPGEYVSLIVFGVAQVKIEPGSQVAPGERLTAASLPGAARPLKKQEINGMTVVEGAPVIGVALAAPQAGQATIPVFVTLR